MDNMPPNPSNITDEIILTEIKYLEDCQSILKDYFEPLAKELEGNDSAIKIHAQLFGNVNVIVEIHDSIRRSLPSLDDADLYKCQRLIRVFLKHVRRCIRFRRRFYAFVNLMNRKIQMPAMKTHYSEFAVAQQSAVKLFPRLNELSTWRDALARITSTSTANDTLESLLIRPIQRICRYPLLFEQLRSFINENKRSQVEAQEIIVECDLLLAKMKAAVNNVNDRCRDVENEQRLLEMTKRIVGLHVPIMGKRFLLERTMTLLQPDRKVLERFHGLLFHEHLLLCEEVPASKKANWLSKITMAARGGATGGGTDESLPQLGAKILFEISRCRVSPKAISVRFDVVQFWIDFNGVRYVFVEDSEVRAEWWIRELGLLGADTGSKPRRIDVSSSSTSSKDVRKKGNLGGHRALLAANPGYRSSDQLTSLPIFEQSERLETGKKDAVLGTRKRWKRIVSRVLSMPTELIPTTIITNEDIIRDSDDNSSSEASQQAPAAEQEPAIASTTPGTRGVEATTAKEDLNDDGSSDASLYAAPKRLIKQHLTPPTGASAVKNKIQLFETLIKQNSTTNKKKQKQTRDTPTTRKRSE